MYVRWVRVCLCLFVCCYFLIILTCCKQQYKKPVAAKRGKKRGNTNILYRMTAAWTHLSSAVVGTSGHYSGQHGDDKYFNYLVAFGRSSPSLLASPLAVFCYFYEKYRFSQFPVYWLYRVIMLLVFPLYISLTPSFTRR